MNRNRTACLALTLVVALACNSTAFAAGSGLQAQTLGTGDAHAICIYEDERGTYTNAMLGALANDVKYLALDFPGEAALGAWYLYGGTTRNGWMFTSSLPCADGSGCGSFVVFLNRNKTWCGYEVSGTDVFDEICGTWAFGTCAVDDTSTPRWFER